LDVLSEERETEGAPSSVCEGGSWGAPVPTGLKRYYGKGDLHFLTFSCHQRLPFLGSQYARDSFLEELARVRRELVFQLVGYVVMPNHVHLLISEPERGTVSTVLQLLKQRVSRKMRKNRRNSQRAQRSFSFCDDLDAEAFWQPRFYDFNVYSSGKVKEKLNYMHANPVIRGLVKHPKDWPWSSWGFYTKGETGLIDVDGIR
jgi:putative transposase